MVHIIWQRQPLTKVDGEKKHDGESDGDGDAHKVELVSFNNFASYSTFGVVGQICPHNSTYDVRWGHLFPTGETAKHWEHLNPFVISSHG